MATNGGPETDRRFLPCGLRSFFNRIIFHNNVCRCSLITIIMRTHARKWRDCRRRCRKRAAEEERPLRQIFDDACRSSDAVTAVSFATVESSMYKRRRTAMPTLPTDPRSCDSALFGSRLQALVSRFSTVAKFPWATTIQL